jgi:hypothetical protein
MADFLRSGRQRGRAVTQRAYALQPVRSRVARVALWALVAIACAAAGATAMRGYAMRGALVDASCAGNAAHADMQDVLAHDELARAQLALKQEAASRASVQKSADALTVEVRRLQAQVLFLQGQSRARR